MKVRTKFKCIEIIDRGEDDHTIKLEVVQPGTVDNDAFNRSFPDGEITLDIDNHGIADMFKAEVEYYVDFSPASKG